MPTIGKAAPRVFCSGASSGRAACFALLVPEAFAEVEILTGRGCELIAFAAFAVLWLF
jgi:hypothetical protein